MGMMYRSAHEAPDLAAVPEGLRPVLPGQSSSGSGDRPGAAWWMFSSPLMTV